MKSLKEILKDIEQLDKAEITVEEHQLVLELIGEAMNHFDSKPVTVEEPKDPESPEPEETEIGADAKSLEGVLKAGETAEEAAKQFNRSEAKALAKEYDVTVSNKKEAEIIRDIQSEMIKRGELKINIQL